MSSRASSLSNPSSSHVSLTYYIKLKVKAMTDLAVIQEDITSWLEVYYKKLNAYNDYRKKDAL